MRWLSIVVGLQLRRHRDEQSDLVVDGLPPVAEHELTARAVFGQERLFVPIIDICPGALRFDPHDERFDNDDRRERRRLRRRVHSP